MALVTKFERIYKSRQLVHKPTRCGISHFTGPQGSNYLQLETYGSPDREFAGQANQTTV